MKRGPAAVAAVAAVAACSSHASKPADQEPHVGPVAVRGDARGPADAPAPGQGDVQVRVEWHDVPAIARSSPGRSTCGTARAPAVEPTTTWGIPDVFVVVAPPGASPPALAARVTFDHCALVPRAIVAGTSIAVSSDADVPAELGIARRGSLADPSALAAGEPRHIQLPVAGHEVDVPLEAGGLYEISADGVDPAWVIAAPQPLVAVTDATGQAVLREVPSGHYTVTAWLPPRAGQPARVAHGDVGIAPGALAEITLDLAP